MRYHSIALHAIMVFRPKCDVQVYILMFLSIRCYINRVRRGCADPYFFPEPDPDGIGTGFGKKIGIGTIPPDPKQHSKNYLFLEVR